MLGQQWHRRIYILFLLLFTIGLSFGKILLSISLIGMLVNYVTEGNFKSKRSLFLANQYILVGLLSIFLIEFIWLIFTNNLSNGLNSLRIKLPLLILPLVIGTSDPLKAKEWKSVLTIFLCSLCASVLVLFLVKYDLINPKKNTGSNRDLSIFMSHIRYAVLLSFGFFLSGYLLFVQKLNKVIALVFVVIIAAGLYQLNSFTSYIAITIAILFLFLRSLKGVFVRHRLAVIASFFLSLAVIASYFISVYQEMNTPKVEIVNTELPKYSPNGEKYLHDTINNTLENGFYLWRNIAEIELVTAWNKASNIPFYAFDKRGQEIKYTIYRYMTSMGLRKDANSLSQLRRGDVIRIENGETTYLKYNLFEKRLRSLIFEFQQYKQTKNPNNQTLIQRFFYWKIALKTFSKHWFFGYGTGGYKEAMSKEYKMASSILEIENQKFPHNQFLTQLINLGLFGFILWLTVLVSPLLYTKIYRHPLCFVFGILMVVSMLSDDMLERQSGVSIFSFIYTLFITQRKEN